MKQILKYPHNIVAVVDEADFPRYPQRVIGYRIGRMMEEDEEEFEEDYEPDELYMEVEGCGMSGSLLASRFGKSIFLTSAEAARASSEN